MFLPFSDKFLPYPSPPLLLSCLLFYLYLLTPFQHCSAGGPVLGVTGGAESAVRVGAGFTASGATSDAMAQPLASHSTLSITPASISLAPPTVPRAMSHVPTATASSAPAESMVAAVGLTFAAGSLPDLAVCAADEGVSTVTGLASVMARHLYSMVPDSREPIAESAVEPIAESAEPQHTPQPTPEQLEQPDVQPTSKQPSVQPLMPAPDARSRQKRVSFVDEGVEDYGERLGQPTANEPLPASKAPTRQSAHVPRASPASPAAPQAQRSQHVQGASTARTAPPGPPAAQAASSGPGLVGQVAVAGAEGTLDGPKIMAELQVRQQGLFPGPLPYHNRFT